MATVTATHTKQGREKENREPTSRLKKRIVRNECEIDDEGGSVRVTLVVATVTATYTKQGREKENREPTSRLKKRIIRNECEIDDEGDSVRVNRAVATVTATYTKQGRKKENREPTSRHISLSHRISLIPMSLRHLHRNIKSLEAVVVLEYEL